MATLRQLSADQLEEEVKESQREIVRLEIMKSCFDTMFKPHELKGHKKKIAKLQTIKREREIEQGVSKRESRRAEKNAALDKYKKWLKESNIVIQRPKSTKRRWQQREAARAAAASSSE